MENKLWLFFGWAIIGTIIHFGFKLMNAYGKESFDWNTFLKSIWIQYTLNVVIIFTLIFTNVAKEVGIAMSDFLAVVIGYAGSSFFKNLMKSYERRFKFVEEDKKA